jgi:hypothetical protein
LGGSPSEYTLVVPVSLRDLKGRQNPKEVIEHDFGFPAHDMRLVGYFSDRLVRFEGLIGCGCDSLGSGIQ